MKNLFLSMHVVTFFILGSFGLIQGRDSITVYLFLLDECRVCQELAPELNDIYITYKNDAGFVGLFPNFSSKKKGIESFVKKYNISFDTKTDYFKSMTNKFGATILPEVVVYNESRQTVLYRGAINDLFYSPGKRRSSTSHHYLKDVLQNIADGKTIKPFENPPIGCFINFNDFSNK